MTRPITPDGLRAWLLARGYDGLSNDQECGCTVGDWMPCGEPDNLRGPGGCVPSRIDHGRAAAEGVDTWLMPGRRRTTPCLQRERADEAEAEARALGERVEAAIRKAVKP